MNTNQSYIKNLGRGRWGWLVLFTSSSTLICCALPILLVSLGLGAVSASLFSALPFLMTVAQYKSLVFTLSAAMLGVAFWAVYRPNRSCPTEPELAAQCQRADSFNKKVVWFSIGLWLIGFSAAYLALPLYNWFYA